MPCHPRRYLLQAPSLYALAGSLNSLFIVVSLYGLWSQLQKIWQRKHDARVGAGKTTDILSLNQFSVSFLAYCAFFVYGYSITPFNHYIVWPRLIASLIALAILYEIDRDRRSLASRNALLACALLLGAGVAGLLFGPCCCWPVSVPPPSLPSCGCSAGRRPAPPRASSGRRWPEAIARSARAFPHTGSPCPRSRCRPGPAW